MMRWYVFGLLLVAVMIFGCVNPSPPVSNSTVNNTVVASNLSTPSVAQYGDNVSVDYTLTVDGKVFDTDNATLAKESGIYDPMREYGPLTFTLAQNSGILNSFVTNIVGMKVGDTRTFNITPDQAYGVYNMSKLMVIPRYYSKGLLEVVPMSYFTQRNITVEPGTSFNTSVGTVSVQNISGDNVTIFYFVHPGQTFTLNGFPTTVESVNMTDYTAMMGFNLTVNETYTPTDPNTGQATNFKVINETDDNITLDSNPPLAGKTLYFVVKLAQLQKAP